MIGFINEFDNILENNLTLNLIKKEINVERKVCIDININNAQNKIMTNYPIDCYIKTYLLEEKLTKLKKKIFLDSYELCYMKNKYKNTKNYDLFLVEYKNNDSLKYEMINSCIKEMVFNHFESYNNEEFIESIKFII